MMSTRKPVQGNASPRKAKPDEVISPSPTDYRRKARAFHEAEAKTGIAAERAALAAWQKGKGKGPRPATPGIDALANPKQPKPMKAVATKPVAEAPTVSRSEMMVAFNHPRQAAETYRVIAKTGGAPLLTTVTVTDQFLTFPKASAQGVVDAAVDGLEDENPTVRDFVAYLVAVILVALPKVSDPRDNIISKAAAVFHETKTAVTVVQYPTGGAGFEINGEVLRARAAIEHVHQTATAA